MYTNRDITTPLIKKSAVSFFPGSQAGLSAIVMLGDSNGEGAGTSSGTYENGFLGKVARAIHNAYDMGMNTDRGHMYESVLQLSKAGIQGINASGSSLISGGVCDSRLSVPNGKQITITNREISSVDIFYDASLSSGTLEFRINGVLYKTHAISGTGTKDTATSGHSYIYNSPSFYTKDTDVITIKSVGGTVVVTEIMATKSASNRPYIYSLTRQGWGFNEFSNSARVTEMAEHVNRFAGAGNKLVLICLGTNNQNLVVGRQLNPTDYITALDNLITAYRTALSAPGGYVKFAVWVPHETLDPRMAGYTYENYIDAICTYCDASIDTQCIRMDMSALARGATYLADNRHFNDIGHALAANVVCDSLGVNPNFLMPLRVRSKFTPTIHTPLVLGLSVAGSNTYAKQDGRWHAEGTVCDFVCEVALSTKDPAMSGHLRISAVSLQNQVGDQPINISYYSGVKLPSGYTKLGAVLISGSPYVKLVASGSELPVYEIGLSDITAGFSIGLSGSYFAQ